MAQEFDFNNPLLGIDPARPPYLEEEEEDKQDQPTPVQEEKPKFSFLQPLAQNPELILSPSKAATTRFVRDVVVKPIQGWMAEADTKRPDSFWENWGYFADAVKVMPANLSDNLKAAWESYKLQAAEEQNLILTGQRAPVDRFGNVDDWAQAAYAKRYSERTDSQKVEDEKEMERIREETYKEINKIFSRINKRKNDAGLGDYGKSVSGGMESMAVITSAMFINALSGGRLTAPTTAATLSYFGAQTQALSYGEARRQGKGHDEALAYAGIQASFEVGTEALPIMRYLSPVGGKTVGDIITRGFTDVATDTGLEVINGVLQEINTAAFNLESDLRTAYDNRNNPLYDGPTISDVLKDVAGHSFIASLISSGSISSIRSTGEVIYSPDTQKFIRDFGQDPKVMEFIDNLNAVIDNTSLNYEAIDNAAIQIFDPNYNQGVTAEELIADALLRSFSDPRYKRIEDPILETNIDVDTKIPLVEQIDKKFPDQKPQFSFTDPLSRKQETLKRAQSGIPMEQGSEYYDAATARHEDMEKGTPEFMLETLDKATNDEIVIVRNRLIYPRKFHDGIYNSYRQYLEDADIKGIDTTLYVRALDNIRDLTFSETNNLSAAVVDLFNAGMPLDIFTDLRFIGANNIKPDRDVQSAGQYAPNLQSIYLSPATGLANFDYANPQGAKVDLRMTLAHELGHHIDYGLGRKMDSDPSIYTPASISSLLFELPNESQFSRERGYVPEGDKGAVMAEALNIYLGYPNADSTGISAVTGRPLVAEKHYFEAGFLDYPLMQFIAYEGSDAMTSSFIDFVKAETFAQMHAMYYTNRRFMEEHAPRTVQLIQELNDAISADSPRAKNARILQAFRSSRADGGFQSPTTPTVRADARPSDTQQQTSRELESETQPSDGDNLRQTVPELENTSLLDFIKQNPEGFTIDPETLETPKSGFAVAPVKALEIVVDQNQINDDILQSYVDNIKELADKMGRDVYAGGWLNSENGKYYLDATVVFDTMEDALYVAEAANQEAIFDLGTFNETRTEQGIQELEEAGRLNSQARDEQRSNIQQLSKVFETTRNLRNQKPVEARRPVKPPTPPSQEPFILDVESYLTSQDASFLFRMYSEFQRMGVDKLDRLKGFMEKLKPFLPSDMSDLDIIKSTDTYYGKVKTKLDDAVQETDVIGKLLNDNKISLDEFNLFLYSLHAPERNDHIFDKNTKDLPDILEQLRRTDYIDKLREEGKMPENKDEQLLADIAERKKLKAQRTKIEKLIDKYAFSGSGMSTPQAIRNLKKLGISLKSSRDFAVPTNKKGEVLMQAFDLFKAYQAKTRQMYAENDLVSPDTMADWDATFKYYVPLVGFAVDTILNDTPQPKGNGVSLYGPIIPEAKGRRSEAGNPFSQAVVRRSEAAVLGERNEINKELAALIREFPADGIWSIKGNQRNMKPHKWDGKESITAFKEDGETKFIVIRDERLAKGYDEFGAPTMNIFTKSMRAITSTLSALYTSYAPEFILTNFTKDYQTGLYNLLVEQDIPNGRAKGKRLQSALTPKNMMKTIKLLRKGYVTKTLEKDSPEDFKYFRAFLENGAQTGYINAKDVDVIEREMLFLSRAHDGLPVSPTRLYKGITQFVESLNNVAENSTRFAAFRAFIEAEGGIDKASKQAIKDAAVLAKNLTINFNRAGTLGPYVNSLYVFANASVQGNVNLFRGMSPAKFDKQGKIEWKKPRFGAKAKILSGIVGFGGLIELYNTLISEEDEDGKLFYDKIPQHVKDRNLIIMLPGVKKGSRTRVVYDEEKDMMTIDGNPVYLKIPLPYGYNMFHNAGRYAVEYSTEGLVGYKRRTTYELVRDMAGQAVTNFSPIGAAYDKDGLSLGKTAVPSALKPAFDVAINEKWTGGPVFKEQLYGGKLPQSSVKLRNTEEFYRDFTKALNDKSGGGEADSGLVNWSPDVVKYLLQSYLGGMYTTIERSISTSQAMSDVIDGIERDIPLDKLPFARIFVGEVTDYDDQRELYQYKEFLRGTPDKPNIGIMNSYEKYEEIGNRTGDYSQQDDFIKRKDFKPVYLEVDAELKRIEKRLKEISALERKLEIEWKEGDRAYYFSERNALHREKYSLYRSFNKYARERLDIKPKFFFEEEEE